MKQLMNGKLPYSNSKKSAAMVGEKTKIALVVTAYFVVSISMVLMNKFLLSKQGSNSVPFFVTWFDF